MRTRFLLALFLITTLSTGCASEVMKGQVATAKKNETLLAAQLEEVRKNQAALGATNAELLANEANFAKERLHAQEEIARLNEEAKTTRQKFEAQILEWTAENDRLRGENQEVKERMVAQNASMSKRVTEVIIPNNGRNASRPVFSDPEILPPRHEGNDLVVEIQDHLIFSPEDDKLSDVGKTRLRTLAAEIGRAYPDQIFRIEANIPRVSNENSRKEIDADLLGASILKAKRVADYLSSDCGVPTERIILAGAGAANPLVSDDSPQGQKRNRRVEWIILGGG